MLKPLTYRNRAENYLKQLGYVIKLDIWVPYEFKKIYFTKRIDICDSLLKRERNYSFWKRMIAGDEKWIVYNNIERKRSWSKRDEHVQNTSKANIHQEGYDVSLMGFQRYCTF